MEISQKTVIEAGSPARFGFSCWVVHVEESDDWIIFPFEKYDEKPSEYHQEIYPELFGEKDEV